MFIFTYYIFSTDVTKNITNPHFRLPNYNLQHIGAKFRLMRDIGETEDENLFEPIRALAEELNRNNILVISTPMWNLTVPYVVKQYIDIVVQPGKLPYYGTNRKLEFNKSQI